MRARPPSSAHPTAESPAELLRGHLRARVKRVRVRPVRVSVQVFGINLGFAVCFIARSLLDKAWGDLGVNVSFLVFQAAPGLLCYLGRPELVTRAFVLGHLAGTLSVFAAGFGYIPAIKDAEPLFGGGKELIPELLVSLFAQVRQ